jgi:hypothetical protein
MGVIGSCDLILLGSLSPILFIKSFNAVSIIIFFYW